jgi:hypothetical protein
MNAKTTAVLGLVVAAIWMTPRASAGSVTTNISFTDNYKDALVNDVTDAVADVVTSGSGTINISLTTFGSGLDTSTFDTNTQFSLNIGPSFSLNNSLGDDPTYKPGKKSAKFTAAGPISGAATATVTVSWTATTLTVTGTSGVDFYNADAAYGAPNAGAAGTTPIYDAVDVNVSLDVFSYDNPNVIVTGSNTDKEVTDEFGISHSLESGSITGAADFTPPVVTVAKPAQNAKITSSVIPLLSGTASDNEALGGVWVMVNNDTNDLVEIAGPFDQSELLKSTNWETNNLDLSQLPDPGFFGTNVLQFYAMDTSSNVSSVVTRDVFWTQTTNMTLQTVGLGSISGLQTNETVNMGQGYLVTAKPGKGHVLESWTDSSGNYLSGNTSFNYIVGSDDGNPNLTATFVPNPYPLFKGTYSGLFFDPVNGATPTNAGCVTLTLATNGTYSGRVYFGATYYSISGQFEFATDFLTQGDTTNWTDVEVKPNAGLWLDVYLQLNVDTNLTDPGAGLLTGTITAYNSEDDYTNYWSVPCAAELSEYVAGTNTVPGTYNVVIPPVGGDSSQGPGGYSYGTATLSSGGAVKLVLNLADGVSPAVSFSSSVAADGTFPFFDPLYSGKGVILGWLQFTNDPLNSTDVEGASVAWVKLPVADKVYTNGFSTISTPFQGMIAGSPYAAPPKAGTNYFGSTNLEVVLSDGNIGFNATVGFNPQKSTFTLPASNPNKLALSLTAGTGAISGSFVPAAGAKSIPFAGQILPLAQEVFGVFPGTNQDTGSFTIAPAGSAVPIVATNPSSIGFTDTYTDSLANNPSVGPTVVTKGSGTISISLPLSGVDVSTFDADTPFTLNVGPTFAVSTTLGMDPAYRVGTNVATFTDTNSDTGAVIGKLIVKWTATNLLVTGTANFDFYGAEPLYGQPNAGMAGTTPIYDVVDVNVSLDVFRYDDPNVFVTGSNTDKEVTDEIGNPRSLESGSITGAADFAPPWVTVMRPSLNAQITSSVIPLLAGSASDNQALASVWVTVNYDTNNSIELAGPFDPFARVKSTSWGISNLDLSQLPDPGSPGTNVLQFYAIDASGNISGIVTRDVFWKLATNLMLQIVGNGTVSGLTNNQAVNMGQGYPVTAVPSNGCVFQSWTDSSGNYLSGSASFNYIVGGDDGTPVLTATFVPNPYTPLVGSYAGLFFDPVNGVTPTNAGFVSVALAKSGAYGAKLLLGTNSYSLTGQFQYPIDVVMGDTVNVAGSLTNLGAQGVLDLQLALNLDPAAAGTGVLSGVVTSFKDASETTTNWSAPLTTELSEYVAGTNTVPGTYNVVVPPVGVDSSQGPGGYGYGAVNLASGGAVTMVLNLADGTSPAVSFSSSVAADGSFPFFFPLYGGNGVFLGWLQFTNDPSFPADLEGNNAGWTKLPVAGKFYTNGFSTSTNPFVDMIFGCQYVAPRAGTNILASVTNTVGSTEIPVALDDFDTEGLGTDDIAANVLYNPLKNMFTVEAPIPQKLQLSLTTTNGLITGSFAQTPLSGSKVIPFYGILLPTNAAAYGYFLGTNQDTGSFLLGAPAQNVSPTPAVGGSAETGGDFSTGFTISIPEGGISYAPTEEGLDEEISYGPVQISPAPGGP